MLTDEVSQIQEVRYCLKTLREQMAARHNNNKFQANCIRVSVPVSKTPSSNTSMDGPVSESQEQECVHLREVTKRLYAQLQEMEKRNQEEREELQAENRECQQRLQEQTECLQRAESELESRGRRIEELCTLVKGLEQENSTLRVKMASDEAELQELRALKDAEQVKKSEMLEKELAVQKEKIHHLDDMLKSQQRKVRHMIEQLLLGKFTKTQTSIKESSAPYKTKNERGTTWTLVDLPGHESLRPQLVEKFKASARAIVFVVDSAVFQKEVKDVAEFLYSLLTDSVVVKNAPTLLIACNKQDVTMAKSATLIQQQLEKELNTLRKTRSAALTSQDGSVGAAVHLGKKGKDFDFSQLPMRVEFLECSARGRKGEEGDADIEALEKSLVKL